MGKILLLAIAIWLVISVLKRYRQNIESSTKSSDPPEAIQEDMVQCAYCGVHLPKSDSFFVNNHYYCNKAHSQQTDA
jgi:uncharacterized protein